MCQAAPFAGIDIAHQLDFFSITMGDVNLDGTFDSQDLIRMFAAAEYEDEIPLNSRWSTGDFNCDGDFDSSDLIRVFEAATYTNE